MKNLSIFIMAVLWLLCCATVSAETPIGVFNWNLLWSGGWEGKTPTSGNLFNRGEIKLNFLSPELTMRGQVLDRRPFNFKVDVGQNWFEAQDFDKAVTHYQGALYHNITGSRLLYGALDEWGLSARLRNPWIRSPPYAENHKPLIADLKTTVSSTKSDEAYLYLSSPFLFLSPKIKTRGFISAQTEVGDIVSEYRQTAASAGLDFALPNKSSLLFETFYTWATLPPSKNSTWFSNPPPLPERDFNLKAVGLLYSNSLLSISSDIALSETFAWGADIYANLGISLSPLVPFGASRSFGTRIPRPLTISLASEGAGQRFVYRDGADHGAGFRNAIKIELKGSRNALLRLSTTLRSQEFSLKSSEGFNRSATNFYYRLPSAAKNTNSGNFGLIRLTRISISADRNADNPQRITDRLYGYIGFSLDLTKFGTKTPIGVVLNGSIRGITAAEGFISPFPIPQIIDSTQPWTFEDHAFYCEFIYSPSKYQFKTKVGYSNNAKNREIWDFSVSGARRFEKGRLSLKLTYPEFPDEWFFNISWRLEAK